MAGWRHAFGDIDPATTFTLDASDPFTTTGAPIAEDALVTEAGIDLQVSDRVSLDASYRGQFGGDSSAHRFEARLSAQF